MTDQFDASASAAGYLYQARVALALLLERGPGSTISIESLDDLTVENTSSGQELVQLKHIKSGRNFGDSSTNLWKTIRIWANRIKNGSISVSSTQLTFFTNSSLSQDSAFSFLCDISERNEKKALSILEDIAKTSKNKSLEDCFKEFKTLTKTQKTELVSLIKVLSDKPNLNEIRDDIEKKLTITTRPSFLSKVVDRVEGWWFDQVSEALLKEEKREITFTNLQSYINDVQEEYHLDNLPIHFSDLTPPKKSDIKESDRIFIEQLKLISISNPRIDKAISDYFKAFNQRTKWVEDGNLDLRHIEEYEKTLKDEWERLFLEVKEDLGDLPQHEDSLKGGKRVFNDLQKRTDLNIKEKCTEAYVMRGTFHILANKLDIGWHPDFRERLKELFSELKEKLSESMDGTPG